MVRNLPPRRLFTSSNMPSSLVKGRLFALPNLDAHFKYLHSQKNWEGVSNELQADKNFFFDTRLFSGYLKEVLKLDINRIYFPCAFTGKVAKAMADSGFDVLASDISPYWVNHLKSIGLRAETLGFEQLPGGKFQSVVSFEPYPIDLSLSGPIGMLRHIAAKTPVIRLSYAWNQSLGKIKLGSFHEYNSASCGDNTVPFSYRYGCHIKQHSICFKQTKVVTGRSILYKHGYYYRFDILNFETIIPTKSAAKRANADLKLLDNLLGHYSDPPSGFIFVTQTGKAIFDYRTGFPNESDETGELSISRISHDLGQASDITRASIFRLGSLFLESLPTISNYTPYRIFRILS